MTQNLVKNITGNVASSYQVNLAIENPNMTENYINSYIFTCRQLVRYLQCLFKKRHVVGKFFFDWLDIFYSGGLGAYRNVSGNLGMKLAI